LTLFFYNTFILLYLFFISLSPCYANQEKPKHPLNVLIIYSWDKDSFWQISFERGLQKGLENGKEHFHFYTEYLDAGRFSNASQIEIFFEYINAKYKNKSINIIIGESDPSINFLNKYPFLLPGSRRILFQSDMHIQSHDKNVKQTNYNIKIGSDFSHAMIDMKQLVKPKKIFVIGDITHKSAIQRIEAFKHGVIEANFKKSDIEYLTNIPLNQLLDKVSHLPQKSAIFYLLVFQNETGHYITPYMAAKRIVEYANAPMFSHWKSLMGSGIIGGYQISGERVGQIAAQTIVAYAHGKHIQFNPKDAFGYYYDWRQLKRWGINENLLPNNSEIMFYEPSLFEKYQWKIIIGSLSLSLLCLLSLSLFLVNRRLKRAKETILRSIFLFNKSQAIANVGSWELDLINMNLVWSDEVYRIFGAQPQSFEPTYDSFINLVHPDDRNLVKSAYSESLNQGKNIYEIEHRIIRIDNNEIRTVFEKCDHEKNASGQIIRSVGMIQDITDQKQFELKIQEDAIFLNTIFENAAGIMMLVNKDGQIVKINREGLLFSGKTQQSVMGLMGGDIFGCLNAKKGGGCGCNSECRTCTVSTRIFKTFETGEPIHNADSHLVVNRNHVAFEIYFLLSTIKLTTKGEDFVLVTILDVTELKIQEFELRKFMRSVENSPLSIVITDLKGNIEYVNPGFSTITGYSNEEALGQNTRILNSKMHDTTFYNKLWQTINSGETWRGEMCNRKKNGILFWEQVTISPVRNQKGEIANFVAIKEDITDRKEMEKLKDDVERIMRHDLKTPLNSIIGFPQLLIDTANLTDRQIKYCRNIEESGKNMLKMINLYLDIFKMESGTYQLTHDIFNIMEIINKLFLDMKSQIDQKALQTNLLINDESYDETQHVNVKGEKTLSYSMLSNLIKNAVEASPHKQTISVNVLTQPLHVVLQIKNQGVVPNEIRNRFFEKYTTIGKEKGTGLGAYSSKLMAEIQGGSITMETSDEQGTTILTVTLIAP